jgi:3-keto-5-aminohexanoate cleavage enzyme
MEKNNKVVICAALSGNATTKKNNPNVPYTPEEFAEEASRCRQEGAAIVHIHAKDINSGLGTMNVDANRLIFEAIKERCPDMIINISTGSVTNSTEERVKPIEVIKPEMCSFNTSTMNFAFVDYKAGKVLMEFIYKNTFADMVQYAKVMNEAGSKPEFEIFDPSGINNLLILNKQEGLFKHPMNFQFVYGIAGGMSFDPMLHLAMVSMLPEGSTFSVCGVGPQQYPAAFISIITGGHVRVGLEDNVRMPDKSLAKGSWEQVIWARNLAMTAMREVASPDEARIMLGL